MTPKTTRIMTSAFVLFALTLNGIAASAGPPSKTKAAKSVPGKAKVDSCSLLTSADVEAVQGEPVKETKPSQQPGSGLLLNQCLFLTPTPSKSITLTLATPDPAKPSGVRRFWRQRFGAGRTEEVKGSAEKGS